MRIINLVIGLPLSGIDDYSEALRDRIREETGESVIVFNSRFKNTGKVALVDYSQMIVADPLCCNYRHLLISEIALTKAFKGVIIVRTYFDNDLDFITSLPKWTSLPQEMRENILTLSREYFPPENAFKSRELNILA